MDSDVILSSKPELVYIEELYKKNLEIMKAKNADYAGDKIDSDFFANFRACENIGIATVEQGILTRIMDKVCRINNLLSQDAKVKDESIQDTISDAINYFAILGAYLATKNKQKVESVKLGNIKITKGRFN